MNKTISLFGYLLVWHRPRVNKVRVLAKILIKKDRLVPFSVVMTRSAEMLGLPARSWSFPVFMLHGRTAENAPVSDEEHVPPFNANPHPRNLPYLTVAQQHHLDVQEWLQ